jgi:2-dehydro-3-deoxy-D-arabinonate dehydratase
MKLVQVHIPEEGLHAGLLEGDRVLDLTAVDPGLDGTMAILRRSVERRCTMDEIVRGVRARSSRSFAVSDLNRPPEPGAAYLDMPIHAPEVWGFGVTYRRSAVDRDTDSSSDIYTRVYFGERPEVFFKATPPRCVGPNGAIGIRSDSGLTAVEPELAFVMGAGGEIVGYTACNDVSAWDIERDNPLYLPQSKIYLGCCALGPVLTTAEEIPDPYTLSISCRIIKKGAIAFEGKVHSSQINRKFEEMVACLTKDNPVPIGTAVSTGTGIMPPNEASLADGDRVEIEIERIGLLANTARQL